MLAETPMLNFADGRKHWSEGYYRWRMPLNASRTYAKRRQLCEDAAPASISKKDNSGRFFTLSKMVVAVGLEPTTSRM
jgi:hypothetical protein